MRDFEPRWIETVQQSSGGKRIAGTVWLHAAAAPCGLVEWVMNRSCADHAVGRDDALIRIDASGARIALLHYPSFLTQAHPALCCSTLIEIRTGDSTYRAFLVRANRPILHRKELLVPRDHRAYNVFASLTQEEEERGLLSDKARIGWSRYWNDLLKSKGLTIEGHTIRERRAND